MSLMEGFNIFRKGIENWASVAVNMLILKKSCVCKIKNLGPVRLKEDVNYLGNPLFRALVFSNSKDLSQEQINILKTYLNQIDNEIIEVINLEDKNKFKFLNREMSLIFESFLYGDYNSLPYGEGKSIVDIGANVADSAIYFANKGYEVFAFEVLPHISEIARKNIDMNPSIKDKITFVNKAVSCKNGEIEISFDEEDTGSAGEFSNAKNKIKVGTLTIENIIEDYNVIPNILKIDCEGCEVNIIKYSDLSMFSEVIFEYHTRFTGVEYDVLVDALKNQGFKIKEVSESKFEGIGIVHMIK